jgi:hypothetical protein
MSAAGKVLIPTSHFIRTLVAARLAADVCDVRLCLHLPACQAIPCCDSWPGLTAMRHCRRSIAASTSENIAVPCRAVAVS